VKELLELHLFGIYHVVIRYELENVNAANIVGTA